MKFLKFLANIVISSVSTLGYALVFVFGHEPDFDKHIFRALWWKDTTARRTARFCIEIDIRCSDDPTYSARHEKRMKIYNRFHKLFMINRGFRLR